MSSSNGTPVNSRGRVSSETSRVRYQKLQTPRSVYGQRSRTATLADSAYTPVQRPSRIYFDVRQQDLEQNTLSCFEDIAGKVWQVFHVTPLLKFEYTKIKLKQYSKRLEEHLHSLNIRSKTPIKFTAEFKVVRGLAQTEFDSEAVRLHVNCKQNGKDKDYYEGFFLSWGALETLPEKNLVSLPVLLCKATVSAMSSVNTLVGKFFGCAVNELRFAVDDFAWLSAIMLSVSPQIKSKSVFHFHQIGHPSYKLSLSFTTQTLKEIWDHVHLTDSEKIYYKEAKTFYDSLLLHNMKILPFDLNYFQLVKLTLPGLSISRLGRIKVQIPETLSELLSFLYDVIKIHMPENATPNLSERLT